MGFHHVGQAGLELLTSGDPPTSASQNARITDVSHLLILLLVSLILFIFIFLFIYYLLFLFLGDGVLLLLPRLECNGSQLNATSTSWVQAILLPQLPK